MKNKAIEHIQKRETLKDIKRETDRQMYKHKLLDGFEHTAPGWVAKQIIINTRLEKRLRRQRKINKHLLRKINRLKKRIAKEKK